MLELNGMRLTTDKYGGRRRWEFVPGEGRQTLGSIEKTMSPPSYMGAGKENITGKTFAEIQATNALPKPNMGLGISPVANRSPCWHFGEESYSKDERSVSGTRYASPPVPADSRTR